MSRENVELVERVYAEFQRGGVEALLPLLDDDVLWEDLLELPGGESARGHDAVRESIGRFYEAWGDVAFEAEELIDAGDSVVVAHRWRGTGKSSGAPFEMLVWNVMTIRDGKVVHRRAFTDRRDALAAAGLGDDTTEDGPPA
jgi:ketosteroid isomerase-like protein